MILHIEATLRGHTLAVWKDKPLFSLLQMIVICMMLYYTTSFICQLHLKPILCLTVFYAIREIFCSNKETFVRHFHLDCCFTSTEQNLKIL